MFQHRKIFVTISVVLASVLYLAGVIGVSSVKSNQTNIAAFTETLCPDHTAIGAAGGPDEAILRHVRSNPGISHCELCHQSPDQTHYGASFIHATPLDTHRCIQDGNFSDFQPGVDKTAGAPFSRLHIPINRMNFQSLISDRNFPFFHSLLLFFLFCINLVYLKVHLPR